MARYYETATGKIIPWDKTIYNCKSVRGCFWAGSDPVERNGETYCPCCGNFAVKAPGQSE